MRLRVFAIYDIKAQVYSPPFCCQHNAEAVRTFQDMAVDPKSRISQHAGDFRLLLLDEFDNVSGVFGPDCDNPPLEGLPKFLANASDYVMPQQELGFPSPSEERV